MDSARLYYHSPLRTGQESKIYLWKESNLRADPVFGGPSRGRVPSRLTWRTQGLLACHLTILNNWVLTGFIMNYHYRMEKRYLWNHGKCVRGKHFSSLGHWAMYPSYLPLHHARCRGKASSKQLNQPLFFFSFLLLNQSLKQSLRMKVKCSYILKQRFTR